MKDFLEDICGDESCFFDKQRELTLLSYTADCIKLGQSNPYKFDLIWTGKQCLAFNEGGSVVDWTEYYKHFREYM